MGRNRKCKKNKKNIIYFFFYKNTLFFNEKIVLYLNINMFSFAELCITFHNILDDLFITKGFYCRKLFYGYDEFYYLYDILKFLNYKENSKEYVEMIEKLNKNKFTINDLEKKYPVIFFKDSYDINQDLINSLNKSKKICLFTDKHGLYKVLGYSKRKVVEKFQDFIYDILLPSLDKSKREIFSKQIEMLNNNNEEIGNLNFKINKLLGNMEIIKENTKYLKIFNDKFNKINEIDISEIANANEIVREIVNVNEKQPETKTVPENKILIDENHKYDLNKSFLLYKINNKIYYCFRGTNEYIKNKFKKLDSKNIIINTMNLSNKIDVYEKLKKESEERLYYLKKKIIRTLSKELSDFKSESTEAEKLIKHKVDRFKEFVISNNILYLNTSSIDDVLEYYNFLIKENY